jgi:hypothetical protein
MKKRRIRINIRKKRFKNKQIKVGGLMIKKKGFK